MAFAMAGTNALSKQTGVEEAKEVIKNLGGNLGGAAEQMGQNKAFDASEKVFSNQKVIDDYGNTADALSNLLSASSAAKTLSAETTNKTIDLFDGRSTCHSAG